MLTIARRTVRIAAVWTLAAVATGCSIEKQTPPPLAGPSEFGLSVTMIASPDMLPRDGSSTSAIRVVARNEAGKAVPDTLLTLTTTAGTLSATQVRTGSNGETTVVFTAPPLNEGVDRVVISATPVGNDYGNSTSRMVAIGLWGPHVPVATFTVSPASPVGSEVATFDASSTTLNGSVCGTKCSYSWSFDDGDTANGQVVQKAFRSVGVHSVTLTVGGPEGTSGAVTKTVMVASPSAPTASFTVTPASPVAGTDAVFSASASTVGNGATIQQYAWNFGDGSDVPPTTASMVVKRFNSAGTYLVTLTVTDSLGRQASRTQAVTVQ